MAPALEAVGTVVAQAQLSPGRHLLTVAAPDLARQAGPGQFAMVRASEAWDPYLRRALPFLHATAETVSFLFESGDPGLSWLAERRLGQAVSLLGPLGHGFTLQPAARLLLLVAGGAPAPLLALADAALASGINVSLAIDGTSAGDLGSIIPEAIEVLTPGHAEGDVAAPTLWDLAAGMLPWADQAAVTGPTEDMKRLAHRAGVRRLGFVQCYVAAPVACGLGWCGSCVTETRRGPRRTCVGGPVFDLVDLV